jgi:bleomycin hydrolase
MYNNLKFLFVATCLFAGGLAAQVSKNPFIKQNTVITTTVKDQGQTGTCWGFSTASFLESELIKSGMKDLDLSEMFIVRKVYLEKGINYIRYHGKSNFSQGALAHDLVNAYAKYGALPESVYSGKINGEKHNHDALEKELKDYLDTVLSKNTIEPHWKDQFEAILDRHMGPVPASFSLPEGVYTAKTYAEQVLKLKANDYVSITSFSHHAYNESFILEVPDNWSNGSFVNVNLSDMMGVVNSAIQNGYSIEWDGDVSEPGFRADLGIALFVNKREDLKDINKLPAERMITASTRQTEFDNHATTDDHLMHITGIYTDPEGNAYYEVKNSWGNKVGFNGYLYMSDKYFQMKTVSIMVNKKAIPDEIKTATGIN